MNILTILSVSDISGAWDARITERFRSVPGVKFSHATTAAEGCRKLDEGNADVVIFGSFGGPSGHYHDLIPHFRPNQRLVLLTGDTDDPRDYRKAIETEGRTCPCFGRNSSEKMRRALPTNLQR